MWHANMTHPHRNAIQKCDAKNDMGCSDDIKYEKRNEMARQMTIAMGAASSETLANEHITGNAE